mgnify:CR=1 FL=1
MSRYSKNTFLILSELFLLSVRFQVYADDIVNPLGPNATFETVICSIVRYANLLLVPISTFMVLLAGMLYMTSGGNKERVTMAHKALLWAVVGIAIVLISQGAILIIRTALGLPAGQSSRCGL